MDNRLRPPSENNQPNPSSPTSPPFPTSIDDKATASYVRRTLCAHHVISAGPPRSIHELLPPLTSSNAVDLQLYAIISVVLKEFVQSWYGKITPDHVFIDEVLQIIAHCTRALEERLRSVDIEALLFDEIPNLIDRHISAFRMAQENLSARTLANSHRQVYHALWPHPAMSPVPETSNPDSVAEQERNEQAWRHMLVQSVLAVLLPTEDLQNGSLHVLVEEILSEIVVGNVLSNRICEPWALWELITNIIRAAQSPTSRKRLDEKLLQRSSEKAHGSSTSATNTSNRLAHYGLLNNPAESVESMEDTRPAVAITAKTTLFRSTTGLLWMFINYGFILFTVGRSIAVLLLSSSKLPRRSHSANLPVDSRHSEPRPIVSMGIWNMAANIMEVPRRMPWLSGIISLAHLSVIAGPGRVGRKDGMLDRLLAHSIQTRILNPAHIPLALRSLRRTLFPANTFPRQSVKSTPNAAETAAIKLRCATALLDVIPATLRATYLGDSDYQIQIAAIETWLDVLGDSYLNRHLVFSLLELCIVRLMPEIAGKGPTDLLDERIGHVRG